MAGYSLKSLSRPSFFLPASNQWSSFPTGASPTLLECISTPYRLWVAKTPCPAKTVDFPAPSAKLLDHVSFGVDRPSRPGQWIPAPWHLMLENLALRHQLLVLQRSVPKPRLRIADRFLWVLLQRFWSGWHRSLVVVQPRTVVGSHRLGFRLFWRWKSRARGGRPSVDRQLITLIRQMWSGKATVAARPKPGRPSSATMPRTSSPSISLPFPPSPSACSTSSWSCDSANRYLAARTEIRCYHRLPAGSGGSSFQGGGLGFRVVGGEEQRRS